MQRDAEPVDLVLVRTMHGDIALDCVLIPLIIAHRLYF